MGICRECASIGSAPQGPCGRADAWRSGYLQTRPLHAFQVPLASSMPLRPLTLSVTLPPMLSPWSVPTDSQLGVSSPNEMMPLLDREPFITVPLKPEVRLPLLQEIARLSYVPSKTPLLCLRVRAPEKLHTYGCPGEKSKSVGYVRVLAYRQAPPTPGYGSLQLRTSSRAATTWSALRFMGCGDLGRA